MTEPMPEQHWFLLSPHALTQQDLTTLRDRWDNLGIGPAIVLDQGLTPVRVTPDGLQAPEQAVPLTEDQFERLLEAIKGATDA